MLATCGKQLGSLRYPLCMVCLGTICARVVRHIRAIELPARGLKIRGMPDVRPIISLESCVPGLRSALEQEPLNLEKLVCVAPSGRNPGAVGSAPAVEDRCNLVITDGRGTCHWRVESLTGLFRGDRKPADFGQDPKEYYHELAFLDMHALELSRHMGDRRDEEMLEIYSALRRRPDGRSLGTGHVYMWQAAALLLGSRELSKGEFEALAGRLERSCRTFRMGPTSRNYVATLHQTIGFLGPSR